MNKEQNNKNIEANKDTYQITAIVRKKIMVVVTLKLWYIKCNVTIPEGTGRQVQNIYVTGAFLIGNMDMKLK